MQGASLPGNRQGDSETAQPAPEQAQAADAEVEDPLAGHPRFKTLHEINRGAFGFVLLAQDQKTGELAALKFIERGPQHVTKYVEREIMNHTRLRHPHIIGLREVFLTDRHLVLAMEFAAGGDLFRYAAKRQRLSEEEARWFFQQLVVAVDYCHRMGVASRDIKLENTLMDSSPRPLIKLADFGLSKDENMHSAPASRVGTPAYLAPEVVTNLPGQTYDGRKADMWSCGVSLFVMVTGNYPFQRTRDLALGANQMIMVMLQRILDADYTFPSNVRLSPEVKDLIESILVVDPEQRPSFHDLQRHPWFADGLLAAALRYNDAIVAENQANPPSDAKLAAISEIVREASVLPGEDVPQTDAEDVAAEVLPSPGKAESGGGPAGTLGAEVSDDALDSIIREEQLRLEKVALDD